MSDEKGNVVMVGTKNKKKELHKDAFIGLFLVLTTLFIGYILYRLANAYDPHYFKETSKKMEQAIESGDIDLEKGKGLDEWRRIQEERVEKVMKDREASKQKNK